MGNILRLPSKFKLYCRVSGAVLLSLIWIGAMPQMSYADLSADQREAFRNGIFYYRTDISAACGATSSTALSGKDNIEKAYNYFIGKGLSREQSAGILGNLKQESQVDPASQEDYSKDPLPKNGVGFGIAQWTFTSRQAPLLQMAQEKNLPVSDLGLQLDYMWKELNEGYKSTLAKLRAETAVPPATLTFHNGYEGSADDERLLQRRITYALEVYNDASLSANSGAAQQAPNGSPTSGCSGLVIGNYAFPVAPQTKRGGDGYSNLPCKASIVTYTDRYGHSAQVPDCHHDHSPAYDLMYDGVAGQPIYAITTGTIDRIDLSYGDPDSKNDPGKLCNSFALHADKSVDPQERWYWYGHVLLDPVLPNGKPLANGEQVKAGDKLGIVATQDYGKHCWGGGPHLHIDRGCVDNSGVWQRGGGDSCRDPAFINDLKTIYDSLPQN